MQPLLPLALLGNLGGPDILIIGLVALLIFGKRLPEVGKNLGKTIVEFKKGLNGKPLAEEEPAAEETEQAAALPPASTVRRLQSGSRVSASSVPAKNLPQTEEV